MCLILPVHYKLGLEINFFYSLPNGQVALIYLARAGMYSVAFMHYRLPNLQYYLPRACGQALNASPESLCRNVEVGI